MLLARMFKAKLLDPIIDRIAERIVHVLLDKYPTLLSNPRVTSMPASAVPPESGTGGLLAQTRKEMQQLSYAKVMGGLAPRRRPPSAPRRQSEPCKQADFAVDAFRYWISAVRNPPNLHCKYWELFYIAQALHERALLEKGRTGLGFGVGRKPLPALFAYLGCTIVATDQTPDNAVKGGWQKRVSTPTGWPRSKDRTFAHSVIFVSALTSRLWI